MPDVAEQQLAVVGAHLGGVDAERVERVERVGEQRAARHGDRQAAKRFTAPRRAPRPASATCRRSTPSAKPTAGSGRPKRAEQVVVAPAAADRLAERGVVDVEDGAGVVAEPARQPEVEDHALGDVRARAGRASRAGRPARRPAGPRSPRATLGRAAQLRHPHEQVGGLRRRRPAAPTSRSSPTKSRVASSCSSRSRASRRHVEGAQQRRVQRRRRRARSRSRAGPTASSAWHRTVSASAVPSGAGAPTSSMPGLQELAHLAAVRAHVAVGVARGSRSAAAARRSRSASRRAARSARSCRRAARAPRRGRRTRGRPAAAPPSAARSTSSYSIAGVETSP